MRAGVRVPLPRPKKGKNMKFDTAFSKGNHYMFKVWYKETSSGAERVRGFYANNLVKTTERLDADETISR